MNFFVENLPYILAGISVGGQYALIAIGYTMVYGILRLINFAHGDMFMVAGLVMVYLAASLPVYIAIPIVIVFTVVLGCTIEVVAYRPLRSAPRMSIMISAIGVGTVCDGRIDSDLSYHSVACKNRNGIRCTHQDGDTDYAGAYYSTCNCSGDSYKVHKNRYGHESCFQRL